MEITSTERAIDCERVSYQPYGEMILQSITGSFRKNKITALIGPSGAGKSSLLTLFNGLKPLTSGNIFIHGKSIQTYDPLHLRTTVGLAFQDAKMIPGTVRQNLALPLTLQGDNLKKSTALHLLQLVQLDESILNRDVRHLSGGQAQRLSLARTLVNRPSILLLDEITASLDPHTTIEIQQLIMSIQRKYKTTIIWITHDLTEAKQVADDVWVMVDGRLIEKGPITLLEKTTNPLVKNFLIGDNIWTSQT